MTAVVFVDDRAKRTICGHLSWHLNISLRNMCLRKAWLWHKLCFHRTIDLVQFGSVTILVTLLFYH